MDRITNNVLYAVYLDQQVVKILEQDTSQRAWAEVDKSKLPRSCFLWIEDPKKKVTWHLPYREGTGGLDSDTKMYRTAGPVNLGALRAISAALGGARTGTKMKVPNEIKSKIKKLLQRYNIGEHRKKENKQENTMDTEIREAIIDRQFVEMNLDKEKRVISNVAILRPTSTNKYVQGSVGTVFSEKAMKDTARLITGKKFYIDHAGESEDKDNRGVRKTKDLAGYFENGRLENNIVRADIHYLKTQGEFLEDLVDTMPDKIGLSIHAFGPMSFDRDKKLGITEGMKEVASADLVTETGSTVNLFESKQPEDKIEEMDYAKVELKELLTERPDIIEAVQKEVKENMKEDVELKTIKESNAALKTENDDLNKKVDGFEVVEVARKREIQILELIEASKLKDKKDVVTPRFMESLRGAKDEADMKALIEDRVKLIEQSVSGVKDMGDENDGDKGQTKEVLEANKKEYEEIPNQQSMIGKNQRCLHINIFLKRFHIVCNKNTILLSRLPLLPTQ